MAPRRRMSDRSLADRWRLSMAEVVLHHGVMLATAVVSVLIVMMGIGLAVSRFTNQNGELLSNAHKANLCLLEQNADHRLNTETEAKLLVPTQLRPRLQTICRDYLEELTRPENLDRLQGNLNGAAGALELPPITVTLTAPPLPLLTTTTTRPTTTTKACPA